MSLSLEVKRGTVVKVLRWLPPVLQRAASCRGKTAHRSRQNDQMHRKPQLVLAPAGPCLWSRRPNHGACSSEMFLSLTGGEARCVADWRSVDRTGCRRELEKTTIFVVTRTRDSLCSLFARTKPDCVEASAKQKECSGPLVLFAAKFRRQALKKKRKKVYNQFTRRFRADIFQSQVVAALGGLPLFVRPHQDHWTYDIVSGASLSGVHSDSPSGKSACSLRAVIGKTWT